MKIARWMPLVAENYSSFSGSSPRYGDRKKLGLQELLHRILLQGSPKSDKLCASALSRRVGRPLIRLSTHNSRREQPLAASLRAVISAGSLRRPRVGASRQPSGHKILTLREWKRLRAPFCSVLLAFLHARIRVSNPFLRSRPQPD